MTARSGLTAFTAAPPLMLFLSLVLVEHDFLQWQNVVNIGAQIAGLFIASLGQMLVALVAGIDLSVGSVISLTSACVTTANDPAQGLVLALAAGLVVGAVNGVGVALGGVHPLVMTLSTMTFVQGLTYVLLPTPGGRAASWLAASSEGAVWGLPMPVWWCAACAGGVAIVLRRTRTGLHLLAVGADLRSAQLNGLPTAALVIGAYMASSALAVVAGLYLTARIGSGDPNLGAAMALESVAAVALGGVQLSGGVGSVTGVFIGSITLGLVTNGINLFGVSPFMRGAITGALLIVAVCVQRRRSLGL